MADTTQNVPPKLLDDLRPRYRDVSLYAKSGFNEIYFAVDAVTGRDVNIHLLPKHGADDELFIARLTHAVTLHASLHHPNVLPLLDAVIGARNPHYTTPHVDGRWLDARLDASGPQTLEDVVNIMASVARALDYCHQSDVLHCDIKPHNILLFDTHVAIHEFTIARRRSDGYDSLRMPLRLTAISRDSRGRIHGGSSNHATAGALFRLRR